MWVGGPLDQALTPCTLANHQQRLQVVRGQSRKGNNSMLLTFGFRSRKNLDKSQNQDYPFLLENFKTGVHQKIDSL